MFDGSYGKRSTHAAPTPREDPSPSNLRFQEMNPIRNDLSTSCPGPTSGVQLQVATSSDRTHFDLQPGSSSQVSQHPLAPIIQGALNHAIPPLLQSHPPGGVYRGVSSHEPTLGSATATTPLASTYQGDGDIPTIINFGGPPTALPNVPSQAGNASQVTGQPPTMAWPNWQDLHPDIFARPNAQGIPGPLWQLFNAAVEYQGGEDLRVLIHFKKVQPQAP